MILQMLFESNSNDFNDLIPIFLQLFPNELAGNLNFINLSLSLLEPALVRFFS